MSLDEKTCPRCAETIKAAAKVCRYCGHEFSADELAAQDAERAAGEAAIRRREWEASVEATEAAAATRRLRRGAALAGVLGLGVLIALCRSGVDTDDQAEEGPLSTVAQSIGVAAGSPAVDLCERAVKYQLQSPNSYRRLEVEEWQSALSYDEFVKAYPMRGSVAIDMETANDAALAKPKALAEHSIDQETYKLRKAEDPNIGPYRPFFGTFEIYTWDKAKDPQYNFRLKSPEGRSVPETIVQVRYEAANPIGVALVGHHVCRFIKPKSSSEPLSHQDLYAAEPVE